MTEFNKQTGNIDLSVDDEEMFKEVGSHFTQGGMKTPWANKIINWLWEDNDTIYHYNE